jgi:hypothetical protein
LSAAPRSREESRARRAGPRGRQEVRQLCRRATDTGCLTRSCRAGGFSRDRGTAGVSADGAGRA